MSLTAVDCVAWCATIITRFRNTCQHLFEKKFQADFACTMYTRKFYMKKPAQNMPVKSALSLRATRVSSVLKNRLKNSPKRVAQGSVLNALTTLGTTGFSAIFEKKSKKREIKA